MTRKIKHAGRPAQPFQAGAFDKLRQAVKSARNKAELQRAQCLWLREAHGLTALEVAAAIGWTESNVRRLQARYLHQGDAVLAGPGRGGRRRGILSFSQELILLRRLRRAHWPTSSIGAEEVQKAYEEAARRRVAPSTIYRMLARHGWRKAPVVQMKTPLGPAKAYFKRLDDAANPGAATAEADLKRIADRARPRFDRFKDGW